MKQLTLITGALLALNFYTIIASKKIVNGFVVEGRGIQCRNSGGDCIHRKQPCKDGFEVIASGKPFCAKNRKCCAPSCCGTENGCCARGQNPDGCMKVYMEDIEHTISYFLRNRAPHEYVDADGKPHPPRTRIINRVVQTFLSDFSQALIDYLPLRSIVKKFLCCFKKSLALEYTISGKDLKDIYKSCDLEKALPKANYSPTTWKGCKSYNDSSENITHAGYEQVRSYPCGIWTTFHAMSVNLNDKDDPHKLLQILHDMVDRFPWCQDCQGHFLDMYVGIVNPSQIDPWIIPGMYKGKDDFKPATAMTTADQVVMWLWRAHNAVSNRVIHENTCYPLKGRRQFPEKEHCPTCSAVIETTFTKLPVYNPPNVTHPEQHVNYNANNNYKFKHLRYNRREVLCFLRETYRQIGAPHGFQCDKDCKLSTDSCDQITFCDKNCREYGNSCFWDYAKCLIPSLQQRNCSTHCPCG